MLKRIRDDPSQFWRIIDSRRSPGRSTKSERIVLTPLSKKACLVHGIDPSVLQQRDYASFYEAGIDPEIQTMRFEVYCHNREKLMQVASHERSKLAAKANDSMSTTDSATTASKGSFRYQEQKNATLIEIEKKRLEKMAKRQQKELLRMLAFESKSQAINEKMKRRADEQAQKELDRIKEKKKKDAQAAEAARIRELKRKVKEQTEAAIQRLKMQQQYERDKKMQQERAKQEKDQKKRARTEERQLAEKAAKHRLETKKIFEQQQKDIERKMAECKAKELAREEKIELKRLVDAQAAEAKRKEAADRIDANLKAARTKEEEKRSILMEKQAKHDELLSNIKGEKMSEIVQQKERNSAMERKRKHLMRMAKEKEEALKQSVKNKIEEEEARREMQQKEMQKELVLRKAEKDILMEMKRDNLARIKRIQEYQQKETLRKVAMNDARSQEMKKKKAELQALRQKNAREAKIEKDKLMALLDQTRSSGGSSTAIKKILRKMNLHNLKANNEDTNIEGTDFVLEEKATQVHQRPHDTSKNDMDGALGLRNLCTNESSGNKCINYGVTWNIRWETV
eukprot:CCRYP_021135-RE/>CCRYP_021135-RE protein AED:0.33 eAED:0.35 QI:0/0.5/0.28/1/0.66/0.42/7/575/569